MGWDASADAKKIYNKNNNRYQLSNKKQRFAFKEAFEFVKSEAGQVDGFLDMGGLDCSACAKMLEQATGRSCFGDGWKSDEIQQIYEMSNWDFHFDKEKAWAYWSARKFLELCAKFKLAVTFNY